MAALASDAELLILDEPTSGLDPLMEAVFQEYIREVRAEGRTVLLSSHILAEAEALCDRVSIIRHGRTVQSGSLSELRHLTRTSIIGRDRAPGRRPRVAARRARPRRPGRPRARSTSTATTWRRPAAPDRVRHPVAEQRPADAGGAVPPPLRRGTGGGGRRAPCRGRAGAMSAVAPGASPAPARWSASPCAATACGSRSGSPPGPGWSPQQSASSQTLYSAPGALAAYQASVGSNAAAIAFSGPPVGLDTVAGHGRVRDLGFSVMLAAALMAMFTAGRHTRADEEAGRTELVRSAHVGRHAPLLARWSCSSAGLRRARPRDRPGRGSATGLPVAGLVPARRLGRRRGPGLHRASPRWPRS